MSVAIKLSNKLIIKAKQYANIYNRSVPKQIEYWSTIGKIAEENPDLPYNFIKEILFSVEEVNTGQVETYLFNSEK
jgi:hypothetical protein